MNQSSDTMVRSDRIKNPSFDLEEYNRVVRAAELVAVTLIGNEFKLRPGYFANRDKKSKHKRSYDLRLIQIEYEKGKDTAYGIFEWNLKVSYERKTLLTAKSTWLVVYEHLTGFNEREVREFVNRLGQFASYPYWRSFVAQLSWASQASLPVLPIMRDPKPLPKQKTSSLSKQVSNAK